jgi:hypothetical protein
MPKRSAPEPVEPEPEEAQETEETEEPEFLNRAARRARGKGKAQSQHAQKGHFPHGQGAVQGPRMWGNRRSG